MRTLYEPTAWPSSNTILDPSALVLFFPSPKTVTGDDILELHVHGGPAVVKAVLAAIPRCLPSGHTTESSTTYIRYAEPGEFTRRAFLNDRLDLTQVEALADTLSAVTEQQRRLSVRGATGGLTKRYESWRLMLLHARGELEALIDFSEDQHFDESPALLISSIASQVEILSRDIATHCTNASRGELLRSGITLSLLGAPNVGKSSLLNRIVGREAAIVSSEAGTTRDVVEVGLDLGGWYCRLGDMAGIRINSELRDGRNAPMPLASDIGLVEQEGIKRAKQRALASDVIIVVLSVESDVGDHTFSLRMEPEVIATARMIIERSGCVVVVVNKIDQVHGDLAVVTEALKQQILDAMPALSHEHIFAISCKTAVEGVSHGTDSGGIHTFLSGLTNTFHALTTPLVPTGEDGTTGIIDQTMWEESLGTNARQGTLLQECLQSLNLFLESVAQVSPDDSDHDGVEADIVMAAENLRQAAISLGKITGKGDAGDVEEVLGVVFEKYAFPKLIYPSRASINADLNESTRFCVGK